MWLQGTWEPAGQSGLALCRGTRVLGVWPQEVSVAGSDSRWPQLPPAPGGATAGQRSQGWTVLTGSAYAVSCTRGEWITPHTPTHACLCFKSHGSTRAPSVTQGQRKTPQSTLGGS